MKRCLLILLVTMIATTAAGTQAQRGAEVRFQAADGVTVWADLYASPHGKSAPLILLFHQGGGDARGEYGPLIPRLLAEGFNLLTVDLRLGGTRFGGKNRTDEGSDKAATYCDAYADVEAALAWVEKQNFSGPRIAWGSSYTATLALRLAAEHHGDIQAVLAFSAAAGEPMGSCQPDEYLRKLKVPALSLRPAAEMEADWIAKLQHLFAAHGHETYVAVPGAHGSSMLVESRVNAKVDETWATVLTFLRKYARHPRTIERDLTFRNGAVELSATFIAPTGPGPFPAVVFIHGSGPHPRAGFRPLADEFARIGVASLSFDKRGSGKSGGSWTTSSLEDLAGDVVAAVDHLKNQKEIDAKRIGFWGVSQAGWVAPLAASRFRELAFLILSSGGGTTPRESELFSYRQEFEKAKLSAAEKATAEDILGDYFEYLATGTGRSQLLTRLETIRTGPLSPLGEQLGRILPSEENRPNWSWVALHDPAPFIASIKCPVLLLFGDRDTNQPTEVAVERWRSALSSGGNSRVTVVIFPGAGHGIRLRPGQGGSRGAYADGYLDVQVGWLWRSVVDRQ